MGRQNCNARMRYLFPSIILFFVVTMVLVSCSLTSGRIGGSPIFDINGGKGNNNTKIFNEESGFNIKYPTESPAEDMTDTPYLKVFKNTEGTEIVLKGTAQDEATIRIKDKSDIFAVKVKEGVFEIRIPITDESFRLDVTAKLAGKKRSGTVIVTNQ